MFFYTYDANGNRVLVDGTDSYTTGDNNQTASDGTYTYLYDGEGNLRFRLIDGGDPTTDAPNSGDTDITEFTWDHRDRLAEVADYSTFSLYDAETPDSVVDYIYDCFNHRVGSLYDTDGDGDVDLEERYVWQGKNVALHFFDSDGPGENYLMELYHRYLWGQAVDQLFAQETVDDGGVEDVLYPVRDNLGSTRSLVEYDGDIAATYSYDSFGNVTALVGSLTATRYLYTCQEYDLTTGFYYYDARWYDPTVGKFISEDPISFTSGDNNIYRYVNNQPLMESDPTGLTPLDDLIKEIKDTPWERMTKSDVTKFWYTIAAAKLASPGAKLALYYLLKNEMDKNAKDDLARRMYSNYLSGHKDPFILTFEDMEYINTGTLAHGNAISVKKCKDWNKWVQLAKANPGKCIEAKGVINAVWDNSSIANYKVHFEGHVCWGGWPHYAKWTGKVWFTDRFDFDPDWNFSKKTNPHRSALGERRTRIAYILNIGNDFDVKSVKACAIEYTRGPMKLLSEVCEPNDD